MYGQEQPLAEFNPRPNPSSQKDPTNAQVGHSDVDVRYHGMFCINDCYYFFTKLTINFFDFIYQTLMI